MATALVFSLWGIESAYAVHNDGVFQIDGDAWSNTCGTAFPNNVGCTGDDWNDLYNCGAADGELGCTKNAPGSGNGATAISDLVVDPSPLTIFTQGGSKDESNLTEWRWTNGSVPDKDDLIEAFAALYNTPDKIIYFGANRLAVNGDAQIGFWFFQNAVTTKADGTFQDSQGNPATHSVGDILILSNFTGGGGSSNIQVYEVNLVNLTSKRGKCPAGSVESVPGAFGVCLKEVVTGTAGLNGVCNPGITGGFAADVACAATNGEVVKALDPDFTAKSGATTGNYPVVGFFEGGLNLTAIGLGGECFPSFAVETRSSQSVTAILKDFTLGAFENCEAGIRTEIHVEADNSDLNQEGSSLGAGASFHDLAIVNGTLGAPVPTGSVTFTRYYNATTPPACTAGTGTTVVTEINVALSTAVSGCPTGDTCANTSTLSVTSAIPGYYSYKATYTGDGNYPATITSTCEPITVGKYTSSIATKIWTVDAQGGLVAEKTDNFIDLNGAATQDVRDQGIVTGTGAPTPTGQVTFTRYQYSNCTGTETVEVINLGTCPSPELSNTACSTVFSLGPNTLGYRATYGGDGNYLPASQSRCEPVCAIDTTK